MCGIPRGRKGDGTQFFSDLLMIGRWKRWKGSFTFWCGEIPLCSSFLSLYEVARSKGDMAAVFWETTGDGGGWNFRFERLFNDWELEEAQRFIDTVGTKSLSQLTGD